MPNQREGGTLRDESGERRGERERGGRRKDPQVKFRAGRDARGNGAPGSSAPIQLYFSIINAYIVTFVNGGVSEGRWTDNARRIVVRDPRVIPFLGPL